MTMYSLFGNKITVQWVVKYVSLIDFCFNRCEKLPIEICGAGSKLTKLLRIICIEIFVTFMKQ